MSVKDVLNNNIFTLYFFSTLCDHLLQHHRQTPLRHTAAAASESAVAGYYLSLQRDLTVLMATGRQGATSLNVEMQAPQI